MMHLCRILFLISTISFVKCNSVSNGNIYEVLPPIFHIDDYEKCKREEKIFCKISIELKNDGQNSSHYWKLIEKSKDDIRAYNHNELFHAVCTNDLCPELSCSKNYDCKTALSDCYTKKYRHLGLKAEVISYNCENHDNIYSPGMLDYFWLFCLVFYIIFVILCSLVDMILRNEDKNKILSSGVKKLLEIFSVISNCKKLKENHRISGNGNLRCIQGIRFYNMLLIIFCHTYSSYIGGYVHNTSYIENISQSLLKLAVRNVMVFLVQTFFLFSGFFVSYHMFQIIKKTPTFNAKTILITFLNRYVRIIPPVIVMIMFGSTMWIVASFYGPIKDLYSDLEYQRCRKNWWTSLLFINNHYNQHDMCYFITWYLAADTQLYVLSLVILSLVWMYTKHTKKILTGALVIGLLIPMIISYVYDLDFIYRITPENSKNNKFRSFQFNAIYSSSYTNMATFMIGLFFGYFYHKYEKMNSFKKTVNRIVWMLCFIGLPTSVILISCFKYSRLINALLSGILKPTYAIGIAIGVFGMAQNVGGVMKSVCNWGPAILMGNITYSTYLVHYGIVFYRTATAKTPLFLSDYVLVTSYVSDAIFSFICGFLMHILVEMPAHQLQKMLLPQVNQYRNKKSN